MVAWAATTPHSNTFLQPRIYSVHQACAIVRQCACFVSNDAKGVLFALPLMESWLVNLHCVCCRACAQFTHKLASNMAKTVAAIRIMALLVLKVAQPSCAAGGVAAIVAALLRDGTAPKGLGPVRCCVISPAAVFSGDLSEACRPFITSLILRCVHSHNHPSLHPCIHPSIHAFMHPLHSFIQCASSPRVG